jgi:flagellin-like hook-associated protein FlgL
LGWVILLAVVAVVAVVVVVKTRHPKMGVAAGRTSQTAKTPAPKAVRGTLPVGAQAADAYHSIAQDVEAVNGHWDNVLSAFVTGTPDKSTAAAAQAKLAAADAELQTADALVDGLTDKAQTIDDASLKRGANAGGLDNVYSAVMHVNSTLNEESGNLRDALAAERRLLAATASGDAHGRQTALTAVNDCRARLEQATVARKQAVAQMREAAAGVFK